VNVELEPEQLYKLDKLVTLLSISEDLTIVFVRCNETVLCNALYKETFRRLEGELFIYDINMSESSPDLLKLLNEAKVSELYALNIKENKKVAFFVFGLDQAIEKKTSGGKSEALLLLNMMRDRFLTIENPVIIWINSLSLQKILKESPDFFSWRTTVLEFDMKKEEVVRAAIDFGDTELEFLSKKELEDRWSYYSRLLKEYQEKGITDSQKFAYWNYKLGTIKLLRGYPNDSIIYFIESLKISRTIGDRRGEGNCLGNLGSAYSDLGESRKAIEYYEQALKISREIGDRCGEGTHLGNLGNAYSYLGESRKAIEYYGQALKISREFGDKRGEGTRLGNLGNAYYYLGELRKAIEYYEQALKISREFGDRRGEGNWLGNLGNAYSDLGESRKAIEYYEQGLKISRKIGDRLGEGTRLGNLGNAYSDLGEPKKAIEYLEQALKIAKKLGTGAEKEIGLEIWGKLTVIWASQEKQLNIMNRD
jgi:G-protein signaling modulator 2